MTVLIFTKVTPTLNPSPPGQGNRIWNSRGLLPPPLSPPHKGEGDAGIAFRAKNVEVCAIQRQAKSPSPLWGGVRGGGQPAVGTVA